MTNDEILIARERLALMELMDGDLENNAWKIPNRRIDENLLIASWNVKHLSNNKESRALQYMADIIERFDIVALQEVKTDMRGLIRLKNLLPGDYRILVSDPTGNYERFAFLFDKRTVNPTGLVCEVGFNVTAKEHTGYQLHRMPYCASFQAGRFDFVIVNVHIFCGEDEDDMVEREKEIDEIVKFVNYRATRDRFKVFDRDFFIIGDFNIVEYGDRFFNELDKKTFQMPANMNNLCTNFNQDKTFDKIAWRRSKSFKPSGECNVLPFSKVVYQDKNPPGGNRQISDHLPLWAEFSIQELTQELDSIINQPVPIDN